MLMPRLYGENLFDELFEDFPFFDMSKDMKRAEKKLYGGKQSRIMSTDIKEDKEGYEIEMDLPGFKKDEIQIALENGYLTIQASKAVEQSNEEKDSRYIRRERYAGACSRSFYVGEELTQEEIKAEFQHGILKLKVPKKEAKPQIEQKKYIPIEG